MNTQQLDTEISELQNNLSAERLDMSLGEIVSMYERNEIIIAPNFEQLLKWNTEQQTQFIESLILSIPVPPIFVAEIPEGKNAGKWALVDGLQRIATVLSFFGKLSKIPAKNNLTLSQSGLMQNALEGYTARTLPLKYQLLIRRATCRVEILKWQGKLDLQQALLKRYVESSSSPSSSSSSSADGVTVVKRRRRRTKKEMAEAAEATAPLASTKMQFNDLITELANLHDFEILVSPSKKQKGKAFLKELVWRFFALYDVAKTDASPREKIKKDIFSHMNAYLEEINEGREFDYDAAQALFKNVIKILTPLGKNVFRGGNQGRGPFSPNIFDIVTVGVALNSAHYDNFSTEELNNKIEAAKKDHEIEKIKGMPATSRARVVRRIEFAKKFFAAS